MEGSSVWHPDMTESEKIFFPFGALYKIGYFMVVPIVNNGNVDRKLFFLVLRGVQDKINEDVEHHRVYHFKGSPTYSLVPVTPHFKDQLGITCAYIHSYLHNKFSDSEK